MCILCVASRWSRRIVTMLPWLIIPLIILWALSQLLPPNFRFEVTSPRLACVGVLLVSLGWYELAMPRLSMWRAKRSALLRERRRIEAQEAAKWRKEATRRCRNCLSAYRDQTPGGGRFMCTFCGHVSKRPVLDVPGAQAGVGITGGMAQGGPLGGNIQQSNGAGPVSGGFFGSRSSRGWVARGWPEKGGWVSAGRGWTGNKTWAGTPAALGWGTGNSSWVGTNWPGKTWTGAAYWGGGGAGNGSAAANGAGLGFGAGSWTGSGYGGGIFSGESCVTGEPHQGGLFFALYKLISFIFFCPRWVWSWLWGGESPGEDGNVNGGRRGGQKKGDESGVSQGSRVDKARRKAEEKRQARLEREQLEAEERRQREEVARLVEERRRQRDEMLEAEKESEREAAAERERELRRERDAERRRQEKVKDKEVKDKDKELAKEKARDTDSEDSKKKRDHPDKKSDGEKRSEVEKKTVTLPNGELKKGSKSAKGVSVELGCKGNDVPVKAGSTSCPKSGSTRYVGPAKGAGTAPLKTGVAHHNNTSFWGKGLTGGLTPGYKTAKAAPVSGSNLPAGSGGSGVSNGKLSDSSYSAWNRMPWTKVWGKSSQSTAEGNVVPQTGNSNVTVRADVPNQDEGKSPLNGSSGSAVFDLPQGTGEAKQQAPVTSQSWQRLFSNNISSAPGGKQEPKQAAEQAKPTLDTFSASSESHTTLIFGHGLQGSVITQHPSGVAPVGQSVQSSAPSSVPVSSSSVTSSIAASVFSTAVGSLPLKSTVLPPAVVPSPIAKPAQHLPIQPPVSGPLHIPAPIQIPIPVTSQSQTHVPQDQLPQILEPWGQSPLTLDDPSEVQAAGDKWRMWDTPQHSIPEPLHWNRLGSSFMDSQKDSLRSLTQSLEPENQLPTSLFSPQQHVGVGCSSGELLTPLSVGNSHSLWSHNNSAFESALRIWATDSDPHQRVPPEFVDCITQEVMLDPVITADGHSYERAAIERWLQTHDTSPITGEVLPPPPGGYGSGVDKTLRPNHILRGQIIEYRENMARLARGPVQESFRDNSWSGAGGLGLGSSAWSTNPDAERPHIGGFYTTPGAHSVWSFDGLQNSVLPPPL